MSPDLPQFIEPSRLADTEARLEGKLDTNTMDRLKGVILDSSGSVEFEMTFSKDIQGAIRIRGGYRVNVTLLCQRCLEPMEITLTNPFNIGLVAADKDADEISAEFEPIIMESKELALVTLIEDELLLGLPMSPMHALEICPATKEVQDRAAEKPNPFAVLKNLKTR